MILQPILMSDASNPSPQEKKFKKFPTSFRWSSQKAQTAQLKCREAEVVRNLETQHENTLEIGSVSFQKRWIKKVKVFTLSFPTLFGGSCTWHAKACCNHGIWSEIFESSSRSRRPRTAEHNRPQPSGTLEKSTGAYLIKHFQRCLRPQSKAATPRTVENLASRVSFKFALWILETSHETMQQFNIL